MTGHKSPISRQKKPSWAVAGWWAASLCALLLSLPAQAAPQHRNGGSSPKSLENEDAVRQFFEFAKCLTVVAAPLPQSLLNTAVGSQREKTILKYLVGKRQNSCVKQGLLLKFESEILRGVFAEVLYKKSVPPGEAALGRRVFVAKPYSGDDLGKVWAFSQCVVMTDPSSADRALRADPLSEQERISFDEIKQSHSSCWNGSSDADVSSMVFRASMAEALYHWSRGTLVSSTSSG